MSKLQGIGVGGYVQHVGWWCGRDWRCGRVCEHREALNRNVKGVCVSIEKRLGRTWMACGLEVVRGCIAASLA